MNCARRRRTVPRRRARDGSRRPKVTAEGMESTGTAIARPLVFELDDGDDRIDGYVEHRRRPELATVEAAM